MANKRGNPLAARGGRHFRMSGDRLVELLLDGVDRIEPVHRVLRDERDIAPTDAAQLGSAKTDELASGKPERPRDVGGRRQDAENGLGDCGLAATGFADEAEIVTRVESERDAIDGNRLALRRAVGDAQVLDFEERH